MVLSQIYLTYCLNWKQNYKTKLEPVKFQNDIQQARERNEKNLKLKKVAKHYGRERKTC